MEEADTLRGMVQINNDRRMIMCPIEMEEEKKSISRICRVRDPVTNTEI